MEHPGRRTPRREVGACGRRACAEQLSWRCRVGPLHESGAPASGKARALRRVPFGESALSAGVLAFSGCLSGAFLPFSTHFRWFSQRKRPGLGKKRAGGGEFRFRRRRPQLCFLSALSSIDFVLLSRQFRVAFGEKHQFSSEKARRRRATGARRSTSGEGARAGALLCGGPTVGPVSACCGLRGKISFDDSAR